MMYFLLSFVFFWGLVFWPDILYLHGMYRHWLLCIWHLWFMDSVYGYVFMAMCLWMCLWTWLCICGFVYGYRVSILREAWFIKYRGLPLLGARFHHHWDLSLHEAHLGSFRDLLLHEAHFNNF